MFEIADLRLFAKLADIGSITGAARQLRMPKSTASRNLQRLEEQAGVRLVQRSTRHIALTDAGHRLLEHARRIVEEVELAETALSADAKAVRGRLKVSAPYTFARHFLGPLLPELLAAHPELRVELEVGNRRVDPIAEDFDLVIRVGSLDDSSLIVRNLGRTRLVLCAAPGMVADGGPAGPRDLARYPLVALNRADAQDWQMARENRTATVPVRPVMAVNDPTTLMEAIERGAGLGWIPDFLALPAIAAGTLVRVLPDWSMPAAEINALYPSRKWLSPKVRVFVEAVREVVKARLGEA